MFDRWYNRIGRNASEYAKESNFHGLRFVFHASTIIARCIWLILFLLAMTGFIYQVQDRVVYFLSLPVRVNIEVEEAPSLKFPAVTICNTNSFVMSTTYWSGLYYNLSRFYSRTRQDRNNMTDLDSLNATDLMLSLAHKKEDMIKKCDFRSEICSHLNFTTRLTDYGVCFTFNGDPKKQQMSTSTGSVNGLNLLLNVEQYQSMNGAHPSAGIKFLLHSPGDFPRVTNFGLTIPVSMNGVIGLRYSLVENLIKPYGHCVLDLESQNNCFVQAKVADTSAFCKCRPGYATWLTEYPVCNLTTDNTCLDEKQAEVSIGTNRCPQDCLVENYESMVTYSTMSRYQARSYATENERDTNLIEIVRNATDVFHRVDRRSVEDDFKILLNYLAAITELNKQTKPLERILNGSDSLAKADEVKKMMNRALFDGTKCLLHRLKTFERIIEFDTMDVTLVAPLKKLTSYIEVAYQRDLVPAVECMKTVGNGDTGECNEQKENFLMFVRLVHLENNIARDGYVNNIGKLSRNISSFSPSAALTNRLMQELNAYNKSSLQLMQNLDRVIIAAINWFKDPSNPTRKSNAEKAITDLKAVVESVVLPNVNRLKRPMTQIQTSLSDAYTGLNENYASLLILEKSAMASLEKVQTYFEMFLTIFNDTTFSSLSRDIENLIEKKRVKSMYGMLNLKPSITTIHWNLGANKMSMWANEMISLTEQLFDFTKESNIIIRDVKQLERYCPSIQQAKIHIDELNRLFNVILERTNQLANLTKKYDSSYSATITLLNSFQRSMKIEEDFIKRNFVALNIYYTTMSYQRIAKSRAYNLLGLICDIGGSAGLYLGASLLTLLELLYFIGNKATVPKTENKVTDASPDDFKVYEF